MSFARMSNVVSFVEPGLFETPPHKEWPFGNLQPRAYSLVVIDPPWTFKLRSKLGEKKSAQAHYDCMTLNDIRTLPVADLAHPDGCMFWIWATAPMLHLQIDCAINHWGLNFATSGAWVKTTKNGKLVFSTGYIHRGAHEPWLICSLGEPEYFSRSVRSVLVAEAREHSRKPDEAYAMAKALIPYGRAADVFTRETRQGFEGFGNEQTKFDGQKDEGALLGGDKLHDDAESLAEKGAD